MHTFAEKPKITQPKTSAKSTRVSPAHVGQRRAGTLILHLQRTIGNQAVQRLLQDKPDGLEAISDATASRPCGLDCSRIPVHASASAKIQPTLAVQTPGDRVSEQVMRMPELQRQRACACGGGCPKCQAEQPDQEHERLQTKHVGSSELGQAAVPSIVNEVLRSPGQPLATAAQAFFEPHFGYDFSQVRVHTDGRAAASAQAVNASAYTVNQDIVFAHGRYCPNTRDGQKLIAHELVHVVQNGHNRIMRDELPVQSITKWQSLVAKGYEEEKNGNLKGMEENFIAALKLIGESSVNVARGGHSDVTKLRVGLNLDVLYTEKAGSTGFLTSKGFTARLPLDGTYPDSAVIIGRNAFQRNSPISTIMVVEHEKTHFMHQRNSVGLLKEWEKKADMKKFQRELQQQKAEFEKSAKRSSMDPAQIETGLVEIEARIIERWFRSQKRPDKVELELFYESIGTMKAQHFDSEVLSGLAGFMKGFHLIEIKNGVPVQDLFYELTSYPVEKGFWTLNSGTVKEHYKKTLTEYYCNKLNETQRKAFDKHVADYKNKKWRVDATEYFKMLQSIRCKK